MHRDNSLIREESVRSKRATNSRKIIRDKSQQQKMQRRDTDNSLQNARQSSRSSNRQKQEVEKPEEKEPSVDKEKLFEDSKPEPALQTIKEEQSS